MWRVLAFLWALVFASVAFPQPPRVTLSVDKRPLTEVVEALAQQTGFQFVLVEGSGERTVTLTAQDASLADVLRRLRSLTGCAFIHSQRTYFVVPLLSTSELMKRLREQSPRLPARWAATVTLHERTSWGKRTTQWQVQFEAPDRFTAHSPDLTVWSEGTRVWAWDHTRQVVTERPSPLWDWSEVWLGVHAVPAFGHGWDKLGDWQPVRVEVAALLNRPCWVLELRRKGSPPTQATYTYTRITLANTVFVPYHEPEPVPWRVRCFLDCQTLTLLRREVFDPRGFLLRIVDTEAVAQRNGQLIPARFEVLDGGMSMVSQGEWQLKESTAEEVVAPSPPPTVLHPNDFAQQALEQAERLWRERDDADSADRLLQQVLTKSNHPYALLRAAVLYAQMNRYEKAWTCLQRLGENIAQLPEAIALAMEVATLLQRQPDLEKWLLKTLEGVSPDAPQKDDALRGVPSSERGNTKAPVWLALGHLAAWRNWRQNRETDEPLQRYLRTLQRLSERAALEPEELPLAWEAAQRCFIFAWRHGRLGELERHAIQWSETPLAPVAAALRAWIAMERGDESAAKAALTVARERCADHPALQLTIAELAEAYGFSDFADALYRQLATLLPLQPEGMRAREHWLRRLMEKGQVEEALRFFLNSLSFYRTDWAKCGWAAEARATATLSLRHSQFANLAEAWRQERFLHPYGLWLYDLMAHFAESEGNPKEALNLLQQAVEKVPRQPFWAARWCQQALQEHEKWLSGMLDEFAAKEQQALARQAVARMDELVSKWRRVFSEQQFFARLFAFIPSLRAVYEENPAILRQLVREQQKRMDEWRKTVGSNAPDRLLMDALMLLNNAGNWLERPGEVRTALLRAEQLTGADLHPARHLARLLFIAFNGVQPDFKQLLPLIDRAMDGSADDTERIAVAQNALQVLVRGRSPSPFSPDSPAHTA